MAASLHYPDGRRHRRAAMSSLSVAVEAREHAGRPYTMVTLAGQVADVIARRRLGRALETCAHDGPRQLVLNLAKLESIDSAAVRELVKASQIARALGGGLAIFGLRPEIAETIELMGADQLIPLYDTAEEALTS